MGDVQESRDLANHVLFTRVLFAVRERHKPKQFHHALPLFERVVEPDECLLPSMMMVNVPVKPTSCPVPESGTALIDMLKSLLCLIVA